MSESDPATATRIRRADPTLRERRPVESLKPFGVPRAVGVLLYGIFSALLIIPAIRKFRRSPAWNFVRFAAVIAAAALVLTRTPLAIGAAVAVTVLAIALGRTRDPDFERKLQRRHGADYLLNGGEWAKPVSESEVVPPLEIGTRVFLLLKGEHLLIVPQDDADRSDGGVHFAFRVDTVDEIRVDGALYLPVYVSEAKQPPVRELEVNRRQKSVVELTRENGDRLRFVHKGAFSRHLADTAAHAIYSVRERLSTSEVADFPILHAAAGASSSVRRP